MKQPEDNKTCDMLSLQVAINAPDTLKRGRGRPPSPGGPMSPAARQAARRARLAESGSIFLTVHISAELLAKLDQFVSKRNQTEDFSKSDAVEAILSERLLRKR